MGLHPLVPYVSLMDVKQCPSCGLQKPFAEFNKSSTRIDGLAFYCKFCSRQISKASHERMKRDPERYAKYLWKERNRHLKRKFGITLELYEILLAQQGEGCAICGATECQSGVSLAVDHCHKTGKIRGILCRDCNTTLGKFNDDRNRFLKAIEYLDRTAII